MFGFQNKYDVNNNRRSLTTRTPAISQFPENGSRWNIFYFLSRTLRYGTEKIPAKLVQQFLHDASISRQTNRQKLKELVFWTQQLMNCSWITIFLLFNIQTRSFYHFIIIIYRYGLLDSWRISGILDARRCIVTCMF